MSYFLFGLARTRRAAGNHHLIPRTVVQTRSLPSLFPVPQSRTNPFPRNPQRQQPIVPALSRPTDRQSSYGLDSDEGEPRYRFRWDTCPSFFPYIALFCCPSFPQPSRFIPRQQRSLSASLLLSVSFSLAL